MFDDLAPAKITLCLVGKYRESLSDEHRASFDRAGRVPAEAIVARVKENGGPSMSPSALRTHRRGGCSCGNVA